MVSPQNARTESHGERALTKSEILEYAERGLDSLREGIDDAKILTRIEAVRDQLRLEIEPDPQQS